MLVHADQQMHASPTEDVESLKIERKETQLLTLGVPQGWNFSTRFFAQSKVINSLFAKWL